MKYWRCKCGKREAWESGMMPAACVVCEDCGSTLAQSPDTHRDPQPHEFEAPETGLQDYQICAKCFIRAALAAAPSASAAQPQVEPVGFGKIVGTYGKVEKWPQLPDYDEAQGEAAWQPAQVHCGRCKQTVSYSGCASASEAENCVVAQAAQGEAQQPVPAVVKFLLGEEPLEGTWFSEKHPSGKPFWWRKHLRAVFEAQQPESREPLTREQMTDMEYHLQERVSPKVVKAVEAMHGIGSKP